MTRLPARPRHGARRRLEQRLATCLAVVSCAAGAQDQVGLRTTEPLELDPVIEASGVETTWSARIGVLAALGPEYQGADAYRLRAVPAMRVSWKQRVIFRGRTLEANIYRARGFRIGPMLGTRAGRDEDRDGVLRGLGDVDRAFEAGLFARYALGPGSLRLNVLHDVSGAHDGLVAELGGGIKLPLAAPLFSLSVTSTWANRDYMQTYFGVGAAQARRARLPAFAASSGFKDVRIGIGTRVDLTRHWSAVVTLAYERLLGDAAAGPLVAEHGNADQVFAGLGALYRF